MDLLEGLNEAQRQAVTHESGPLLIVAGAGTGKTTVLTRRYAYLLQEQGLSPDQILALTFTDKAANEMEERVLQLLPTGAYDFWISTFHAFCQRVLEAHALEIGLPNHFRVLSSTDAWLLLKRHLNELPLDHYRPLGHPVKFLRALVQHISRAKDEGVTPEAYLAFAQAAVLNGDSEVVSGERKRLQELADVYVAYRRLLLSEGCLDFGDLILETLRLFQERPAVLESYRSQFRFVMVDEFQDTNWAQYELLKLLAGASRNLAVVGDDDQAIYKFRGASLANILQFREDFPDTKTVALTQNYRSREEILTVAYQGIQKNNPHRLEVQLQDTGLSKKLEAVRGSSGNVTTIWEPRVEDEVEAVIAHIRERKAAEADTSWNDFAILVRSNDGAEPFVHGLERQGIPFQFMALRGLYTKPVIVDVIAFLSVLDGYRDATLVWRVLSLPCYPVPARDRAELLQEAQRTGHPLWSVMKQASERLVVSTRVSEDGKRAIARLVADVEALSEQARRASPLRMLQEALKKTEYLASVLRLPEREKRETLQWLNAFAERIKRYEAAVHDPSLREFLEELHLEMDSGEEGALDTDPEAGPELVKILTVHAAKGLEFKHVFVVSLVDQRFPTRARGEAIPLPDGLVPERLAEGDYHVEEERRLLYVALTRAKDTLTVSGAADYGGTRLKKPSVFWEEAGFEAPPSFSTMTQPTRGLLPPEEAVLTIEHEERTLYPLKRRFSFTQLAAFRTCPLQYKFSHIYRIPVLGRWQKSFGQSMHLTFQRLMELHLERGKAVQGSLFQHAPPVTQQEGFRVTEEEALEIFEEAWIDEWYEKRLDHDEQKRAGRAAVRELWQAWNAELPDVFEVERNFTLVLGAHSLKGKIDRVDRLPDGSVMVVDYKTGRSRAELESGDKEQLHLYQLALEERGLRVGKLAYLYVMDGTVREVEPLVGDKREAFIAKLLERMDGILVSDFQPTPSVQTCGSCDFKHICEFRKM